MISPFKFHTSKQYADAIRVYGFHLIKNNLEDSIQNDITADIITSQDNNGTMEPVLGLPIGAILIPYKPYQIEVEITESKEFKGSGSGLAKWIDVYVNIFASNLTEAEKVFIKFCVDAMNIMQPIDEFKLAVQIYDPKCGWRHISNLSKRPMDTIYIDPIAKQKLMNDIQNFVNDEEEYIKFGIPYKRCYLFHGKAGSGKTSLILALASLLKRNISIFPFSVGITDATFIAAISQLNNDRILVLEDLDALFINRNTHDTNTVSFSALLNVLDGACRKDKMITFITSNYIKLLDSALLRPGRVDYLMEFSFAGKNQIKEMYDKFIPNQAHNFNKFYEVVNNRKINMSLIQKYLFEHRKDQDITKSLKELSALITKHEEKDPVGII